MQLVDGLGDHHPLHQTSATLLADSEKSEKNNDNNTSQSLYGLVYNRKHLLLDAFVQADAQGQGLVTVEQWAEVMKQVIIIFDSRTSSSSSSSSLLFIFVLIMIACYIR